MFIGLIYNHVHVFPLSPVAMPVVSLFLDLSSVRCLLHTSLLNSTQRTLFLCLPGRLKRVHFINILSCIE